MKTVKILSKDLEPLGDTSDYLSMIYTNSWHTLGDFELVIHRESNGTSKIKKGCLIALSKEKIGIVRKREIQLDQNGKASENWLFTGHSLKGLVSQRVTLPPTGTVYDNISGDAETVMKHFINNNLVNPADPSRAIPNLVIAPNQNRGESISWKSRYKKLDEELEEISLISGLGWDITLDTVNNQFVFDVYEGKDLSVNQTENSPVYFAPEFGNVKSQSFSDSDIDMKNVGYVAGQGEGADRLVVESGESTGVDRYETFVDARDIGDEILTEQEEIELLKIRGTQKMKELKNELYFEAEIMNPLTKTTYEDEFESFVSHLQPTFKRTKKTEMVGPFVYEKDYNLGDITTQMNREWGVIVDQRITEFTEVYEASGFNLEVIFGQKRPTLITKIKDEFKQYENELKR
ncbi:siphovirus ReqiPepy6 Gp37-like family protein [Salipaludibacillus sp. CF4.18]|uniref:siphovirus ReqiPepy6 Gp37-like family protein n=1 Tax=Salipaludibacillus sp. CF4.18 TaxID=3373081 RepID=UPI003EE74D38